MNLVPGDLLISNNSFNWVCFVVAVDTANDDQAYIIEIGVDDNLLVINWHSQDFVEAYYELCSR